MILLLAVCAQAFSKKPAEAGPVDFELILAGQHSRMDTAAVFLVDNQQDWEQIWQIAQGRIDPLPPVKEVDFTNYSVIAVFRGTKNSGGYSVEIGGIEKSANELKVNVVYRNSSGGMVLPVVTSPYQIVRIPKGDYTLNVEYIEKEAQ